jgi:hypothetical protein
MIISNASPCDGPAVSAERIQWRWENLTAHRGKALKLCAEANAARRAVTTTVRGDMASFLSEFDWERLIDRLC